MQALCSAAGRCAALASLPAAVLAERLCTSDTAGTTEGAGAASSSSGRSVWHWRHPPAAWAHEPAALQSVAAAGSLQDSMLLGRGDPKTKRGKVRPSHRVQTYKHPARRHITALYRDMFYGGVISA